MFIDGTIFIENTIAFTTADSGNNNLQINYKALDSANKPTISGGYVVPTGDIADNAGIWEFTLPLAYRSIYDSDNHDLYLNGVRKKRTILSYPLVNVMTVKSYSVDVAPSGDVEATGYAVDFGTKTIGLDAYICAKLRTYTTEQINSCVFHCIHKYDHWIHNIDSVDPVLDVIYCTGSTWNQDQISVGSRCWIENVYEPLFKGQFYSEVGTGVYTYKPETGETIGTSEIVIPVLNQMFTIEGNSTSDKIENVHFENIKFKYTNVEQDWYYYTPRHTMSTINDAILLNYTNNVTFKNIEVEHIGENFINYFRGCTYGNVELSYFYDVGASPVHIGEFTGQLLGDQPISQDTHHNTVTNNIIHHVSVTFLDSLGVEIRESSDNTISYNEISGVNNFAISVGAEWTYLDSWNTDNVIHKNHISYINPGYFSDSGAVHLLAGRTGTIISNNVIHDVWARSYNGIGAIFPDNGSIGCIVENNLVYNTRTGGYHQNFSKDVIVRNNIFAYANLQELEISVS